MSFSFGTPAATATGSNTSTGGFGGFGAPATSAPATTTSGFGGFGGFGTSQAPSSTPAFGTTNTTTPASNGLSFGAPVSSAPSTGLSFGNTAPSTGLSFGAPASSAPTTGLSFGAPTSTAPSTGFSFGNTTLTSAAPNTSTAGGLFGSTNNTATTGFGGFGATANKPAFGTNTTTPGLFGNKPAGTTSFFGGNGAGVGFGNQPQGVDQQRAQQVFQLMSQLEQLERTKLQPSKEGYKPDNVWNALAKLKSWWDPADPKCRFKHYFYNVVPADQVHLYQKPADHDQAAWDAAQAANPDPKTMVPALAIGFDDIQKRMDQQQRLSDAHNAKLDEIQILLKEIQRKSQLETTKKIEEYKRRHMQTAQRLVTLLKYAQVLRNKGLSITPDEEHMRSRLEDIQDQLQRSEQFHGKLSQLWAQLQLIKESGRKYGKIDGVDEWDAVSEEKMASITKILDEQNNGVQHIIQALETDTAEIDQLHKGWSQQRQEYHY
ncbi:Nucleoporin nup44 [Choanephora cucurbitarum]|uniref:Nucleoporin nup44 n=1 Tax=Choanephora cucurbitarum TaxID=101091 RepID=A0A1C7NHJ6_9FUNG|nr:Nucleoporin nup44 [Choanephora cucurbitarum]